MSMSIAYEPYPCRHGVGLRCTVVIVQYKNCEYNWGSIQQHDCAEVQSCKQDNQVSGEHMVWVLRTACYTELKQIFDLQLILDKKTKTGLKASQGTSKFI